MIEFHFSLWRSEKVQMIIIFPFRSVFLFSIDFDHRNSCFTVAFVTSDVCSLRDLCSSCGCRIGSLLGHPDSLSVEMSLDLVDERIDFGFQHCAYLMHLIAIDDIAVDIRTVPVDLQNIDAAGSGFKLCYFPSYAKINSYFDDYYDSDYFTA